MPAAINQIVTVRPGGVVEVRSPELREGDRAEVTVVVVRAADRKSIADGHTASWRRYAGAFNSRDVRAGDNERIDSALAAEYANKLASES